MKALLVSISLALSGSALADGSAPAEDAALLLAEAAQMMEQAQSAPDRIIALTATVRAYETGLAALREGLVASTLRKRNLEADLQTQDAEIAEFLSLLQVVSKHGHVEALVHPGGMRDTIHAGFLVSGFVPQLHSQAQTLERKLVELADVAAAQKAGLAVLESGLAETRAARRALAAALEDRLDLPPRRATDEAAMLALLDATETLQAFAAALLPGDAPTGVAAGTGWTPPVEGRVLHGFKEKDAAGLVRPGVIFSAPAKALIVAPTQANVRFSGEIPGHDIVVILEPRAGELVILAGLGRSFVQMGHILEKGAPLGLMGGSDQGAQEKLNEVMRNGGLPGQETLYMEVSQGRGPIDPMSLLTLADS